MVYHLFEGEVGSTSSKFVPFGSPTKKIGSCYLSTSNCVRVYRNLHFGPDEVRLISC